MESKPESKAMDYQEWWEKGRVKYRDDVDIYLNDIRSVENIGLILRMAEGMGVRNVYSSLPIEQNRRLERFSRSASAKLNIIHLETSAFLEKPYAYAEVWALEYTNRSQSIYVREKPKFPLLLILGSEAKGISTTFLKHFGVHVHLPLGGTQSSVNVAMAFAGAITYINQWRS